MLVAFASVAGCKNELRPVIAPPDGGGSAQPLPTGAADTGVETGDGPPPSAACTSETFLGQPAALDLALLIDVSTSMTVAPLGSPSKWEATAAALKSYLRAPVDPSLGLGIQVFPLPARCTVASQCETLETCEVPQACANAEGPLSPRTPCGPDFPLCPSGTSCRPVGRCPASGQGCSELGQVCPGRLNDNVCRPSPAACIYEGVFSPSCIVGDYGAFVLPIGAMVGRRPNAIDVIDEQAPEQNFGTPLGPALEGTLAHLRMHRQAHPERRTVLAVISDGEVTACGPTAPSEVSAPVRRARLNDGITTHVLSVTDGSPLANEDVFMLDALAAAGGTGGPQFFDAADDLTFNLGRALDAIHAAERPCAFDVPEAALRGDGRSTEVSFAVGGATLKLPSLAGVNACAAARDGWFVATLANGPARIGLCEGTCRRLRADPAATLEVRRTCAER